MSNKHVREGFNALQLLEYLSKFSKEELEARTVFIRIAEKGKVFNVKSLDYIEDSTFGFFGKSIPCFVLNESSFVPEDVRQEEVRAILTRDPWKQKENEAMPIVEKKRKVYYPEYLDGKMNLLEVEIKLIKGVQILWQGTGAEYSLFPATVEKNLGGNVGIVEANGKRSTIYTEQIKVALIDGKMVPVMSHTEEDWEREMKREAALMQTIYETPAQKAAFHQTYKASAV
jgi:hypothetical protein